MNIKERMKTYSFWISLASAIFLVLKVIGQKFGFTVDETIFNDIVTTLCSILVILGIIVPPGNKTTSGTISTGSATTITESTVSISNKVDEILTEPIITKPSLDTISETEQIESQTTEESAFQDFNSSFDIQQVSLLESKEDSQGEDTNSNTLTNIEISYDTFSNTKQNFYNFLNSERENFVNNKSEFIKILKDEITQLEQKTE